MSNQLVVPALGESITEAVVAKWLKNVGEFVAADEPVADLETDKVTVSLPSPVAGVLTEQKAALGATVKVGEVIGTMTPGDAPQAAAAPKAAEAKAPAPEAKAPAAETKAPAAAAKAPEAKAPAAAPKAATPTPAAAPANGHGGEIPRSKTLPPSVRKALREGGTLAALGPSALDEHPEEVVAMSPLRKRIAERLVEAQHTAAILTTFNEVDMTAVMDLRARFQDDFVKRHGVKLGFMSFFVKACVEACKLWPGVNAEMRGTDIVYKKHYDFGIAVGGGKGLVVPVLRNCDELDFAGVEKGIAELATKAKENKLTLPELSGGTFSITNGGIYGSMLSTPLLNMPQTGILGMHNIVKRAVVIGDEIKVRPMMFVALSYDHRVVDGREAVSFLVAVKERLENPDRLLLSL